MFLREWGKSWISFKYECLPNLCYWCGRLTHGEKDGPVWIQSRGSLKADQKQFSALLKAPPYMPQKEIFVPGFYDKSGIHEDEGTKARDSRVDTAAENVVDTAAENKNSATPVEEFSQMDSEDIGETSVAAYNAQ